MSDTPRCDAYEVQDGIRYNLVARPGMPHWPTFARSLERELAELRQDAERYRYLKTLDDWFQFQGYLEVEPDGLDEHIDRLRSETHSERTEP
jgi:hypothetical protein